MPSGAGVNRWGKVLLSNILTNQAVVNTPLTTYGTIGANDSGAYSTPIGFTKWTFQIVGVGANAAGYSISFYGCIDPQAYATYTASFGGGGIATSTTPPAGEPYSTGLPTTSWSLLPFQSATGGGTEANPLVSGTNTIGFCSGALIAIRACLTTIGSPTSPISVIAFAVP